MSLSALGTGTLNYFDGTAWRPVEPVVATGGTESIITVDGRLYKTHTYLSSDDFVVSRGGEVEYLVVAGGGAGATGASTSASGAGGGAGGLLTNLGSSPLTVVAGTHNVVVGAGGTKPATTGTQWTNLPGSGVDSSVFGLTAIGGGRAGIYNGGTGGNGGSGGGRGGSTTSGSNVGLGTSGQGNDGGPGNRVAGAGGGAGAAGENRVTNTGRGNLGGAGLTVDIDGRNLAYAGGGSSGSRQSSDVAAGGLGGGGAGGVLSSIDGEDGEANTGGGGGGGYADTGRGGAGGDGIVIIRYPL